MASFSITSEDVLVTYKSKVCMANDLVCMLYCERSNDADSQFKEDMFTFHDSLTYSLCH